VYVHPTTVWGRGTLGYDATVKRYERRKGCFAVDTDADTSDQWTADILIN